MTHYTRPDLLWDYLRFNLEPSIMASPDGHRWALAVDALERCQTLADDELHLRLLKAIALIDMFKERSGLVANAAVLRLALPEYGGGAIKSALETLQAWSLLIYRKYNDSYSVFEGSDFDIEDALGRALATLPDVDYAQTECHCRPPTDRSQAPLPQNRRVAMVRRRHRAPGRSSVRRRLLFRKWRGRDVPPRSTYPR